MSADQIQVRDERKPGHHWADNEVLDFYAPKIGAYSYAVYMFMGRHASNVSGRCSKSQSEIAAALAISIDSVQRAINRLIDVTLIKRELITGKPSVYVLLSVPKLTRSTISTDLPPKAVTKDEVDLPLTAVGIPPIAVGLPLTAVPNKEERLIKTISRRNQQISASVDADPRHKPIQKLLIDNYAGLTKLAPEKVEWDGREGKALATWLAAHPRITLAEAAQCVNNFFASDGPVTQRLAKSIPTLLEYFACELNQFKTPRPLDRKWADAERQRAGAAVGSNRSFA